MVTHTDSPAAVSRSDSMRAARGWARDNTVERSMGGEGKERGDSIIGGVQWVRESGEGE